MSLSLAALTTAALAIPAFADNTTEVEVTYADIPIAVTVPESGTAQINPYGLPVDVALSTGKTATFSKQQITTAPLSIKNDGNVDLEVGATVTTSVGRGSGVEFVKRALITEDNKQEGETVDTGKQVYAYLQVAQTNVKTDTKNVVNDDIITACATDSTWTNAKVGKVVLDGDNEVKGTALATLKAAATPKDGSTEAKYAEGSIAVFRLAGEVVEDPADDAWSESDGFTTTIAFTFKPGTYAAYSS
jgi:hypothetical protein